MKRILAGTIIFALLFSFTAFAVATDTDLNVVGETFIQLDSETGTVVSAETLLEIKDGGLTTYFGLPNGIVVSIDPATISDSPRSIDINVELIPINQAEVAEEEPPLEEEGYWVDEEPEGPSLVEYDLERQVEVYYIPKYEYEHSWVVDEEKGVGWSWNQIEIETGYVHQGTVYWKSNIILIAPAETGDLGLTLQVQIPESVFAQAGLDLNADELPISNPLSDAPRESYTFDRNTLTASLSYGAYYYVYEDYSVDNEYAMAEESEWEYDEGAPVMVDYSLRLEDGDIPVASNPETGVNVLPITAAMFAASAAVLSFRKR